MSMPAHRSTAAAIIRLSFQCRRTVDVYWDKFFLGSTAPFGGPSHQPGQFRLRVKLRAITHVGPSSPALTRLPLHAMPSCPHFHYRGWLGCSHTCFVCNDLQPAQGEPQVVCIEWPNRVAKNKGTISAKDCQRYPSIFSKGGMPSCRPTPTSDP